MPAAGRDRMQCMNGKFCAGRREIDSTPLGFEGGGYVNLNDKTMNRFNHVVDIVEL